MKDEFVSYENAIRLKALGFDKPCFAIWYNPDELSIENIHSQKNAEEFNGILAPLYQQAYNFLYEINNQDIAFHSMILVKPTIDDLLKVRLLYTEVCEKM